MLSMSVFLFFFAGDFFFFQIFSNNLISAVVFLMSKISFLFTSGSSAVAA